MRHGIGLYLHLPFCLSKCAYCDFDSAPLESVGGTSFAGRYLGAMAVELDRRAASEEFHGEQVDTVYLGGGTPTIMPAEWITSLLERVRNRFPIGDSPEITIEANPGTITEEKMELLLAAGVNRVSLGVQSFSDSVLRTLGRPHSAAHAKEAIELVRRAGCANLGVDLIYGVPDQGLTDWESTLRQTLALSPDHVSAYALSAEPGTRLADDIAAGRLPEPDEELSAQMYALVSQMLASAGYRHYEISSFALPGYQCRHNRRYWANAEYLGLGCSAHSYRWGLRWNNVSGAEVYTDWMERGVLPVARAERLSARQRLGETLMLGLRCEEGVDEEEVTEACGLAPHAVFGPEIQTLCEQGLLAQEGKRLRIPRERWFVSNEALSCFVG